ncbi:MAG: glycosyl hydrolase family 65 protein, partial [Telluria sp.]
YDYFMETARLDLDDTHGNTHYGVHTAAMAGTWMGVAYGFGGMRVSHGELRFAPTLPKQWQHYRFQVQLRGAMLAVRVSNEGTEYTLLQGDALDFTHFGQAVALTRAAPHTRIPLEA